MNYRFPAEWEEHAATWIAWPHEESDWPGPGKLSAVKWTYAEIARLLVESEHVNIIVENEEARTEANEFLASHGAQRNFSLRTFSTDRSWLRDSAPTAVKTDDGKLTWIGWRFNGWAKYENYLNDEKLPAFIGETTGGALLKAQTEKGMPFVLEGGAIDTDGRGTLLVTEECLLSTEQQRNPGLGRREYERLFRSYLGIRKTIWLPRGICGDDTHGHIDDLCRFVGAAKVVVVCPEEKSHPDYQACQDAIDVLSKARDAEGREIEVFKLPLPREVCFSGQVLPASYANFYIANKAVLVPTFNDANDVKALSVLQSLFPERRVVGLHCLDLVLGLGTLHCLTQQQPA